MQAKDVMTTRLELINRRASLREAATKMAAFGIGALPVVDRGSRLVGMVTDRDIAVRGVARGLAPEGSAVEEVMTAAVVSCDEDEDVRGLAAVMEQQQLRRIIVTNAKGKPVGIVSLEDLANRTLDKALAGDALHRPRADEARTRSACGSDRRGESADGGDRGFWHEDLVLGAGEKAGLT